MSTVHFVYPRDAARHASPWCIGNEVGDRLAQHHDVRFYSWRDDVCIEPQPGDVLVGHPHASARSVFRRSLRQPGFARRIAIAPYSGDVRLMGLMDGIIDHCDLFLAITGNHWFARVEETPMARWRPKMRHIDLAVNRTHFPRIKTAFHPPGRRRFVYIGNSSRIKNTPYLSEIAAQATDCPIAWIGQGRREIAGVQVLGRHDFRTEAGRQTIAQFDFMLTVGARDPNPTTILESMAWGLIPVCTRQSGYDGTRGVVNVPLDDAAAAARVLSQLQHADDGVLRQLQADGDSMLQEHFNWDRVHAQVEAAIASDESPAMRPATFSEAALLRLFRYVR